VQDANRVSEKMNLGKLLTLGEGRYIKREILVVGQYSGASVQKVSLMVK